MKERHKLKNNHSSTSDLADMRWTLEVGCGGGKYVFVPRTSGENILYLDIDKPSVQVKNFVRGDASHLPFRNWTFAEIFAGHIIEHLNDPARFLRDSYFLLEASGKIHIWCPNFLSSNATKDPTHKHVFNFWKLRKILKQSDYRPIFSGPTPALSDRFPRFLVYLSKTLLLLLCNELYVVGIKKANEGHQ